MRYLFSLLAILFSLGAFAQPTPACGDQSVITYYDPVTCNSDCAAIHAIVNGENPISAGITIDDIYSGVIPIGFTFNYYGIPYTQCIIGANGMVNFDLSLAGTYDPWYIGAALLGNTSAYNSICGPWCDIYPPAGGTITYATSGTAPFRRFTATWCHCPMFTPDICPGEWTTTQIILYEGCDFIDVHVGHKTSCPGWNGGYAILGVQNGTGSNAVVAPGHDYPATYTCIDEGWRFSPLGTSYTVASIAYAPVPNATSPIIWYSGPPGSPIVGMGPTLECVPLDTFYRAEVAGCDFVSSSTVVVPPPGGSTSTGRVTVCVGSDVPLPPVPAGGVWSGGPPAIAILNPFPLPGSVHGVSPGVATFNYVYGAGCVFILTVEVELCDCSDTCYWTVSGNNIHAGRNKLGTLSNDDIRIISNNTDRAILQANGNMGIRQMAPTTTLDVDCIPVMAPSGLRFENLPFGHGNVVVVDPAGYVFLSPMAAVTAAKAGEPDLQEQINQLKQQLEDLKAQLGAATDATLGNSLTATPNPTNGQVNVSYTIASTYTSAVIKITDVQGRQVVSRQISSASGTVGINIPSSTAPGDLIITLVVDGKIVARQKEVLIK